MARPKWFTVVSWAVLWVAGFALVACMQTALPAPDLEEAPTATPTASPTASSTPTSVPVVSIPLANLPGATVSPQPTTPAPMVATAPTTTDVPIATPAPFTTAVLVPGVQGAPLPGTADPWTRIERTGRMIVGVSADYPPFEFYNESFHIDGFDPALMGALARKLGLQLQILDIAFEGLPAALQLGQIDAAISAISVTPARMAVMDFSQIYFVSDDAIVVAGERDFPPIVSLRQLTPFRIGVQEGSFYESLLRQELVQTGLMPEGNLLAYRNFDSVVSDLQAERLDIIMMDLIPAERLMSRGDVRIIGRGLNSQSYAIAVPKGAYALQAELNRALEAVREDGTLAQLVADYLLIEPPDQMDLPTSAPAPVEEATPAPPPAATVEAIVEATPAPEACVEGMAWLADLNFDDANMQNPPVMAPGQPFQKGWRIQNTGTCIWNSAYRLAFVQGNVDAARMGGAARSIMGIVPPGNVYDIYVDLTAPIAPGTYQGFWQMLNGEGAPFGERVWVGIQVPAPPTPTPIPSPTPANRIDFQVDRTWINAGERVVFSWRVEDVAAVYFYAQGQRWQDHGVGGVDSRQVYPAQSTTYELRVVDRDGQVRVWPIRVEVVSSGNAPRLARFTVEPPGTLDLGQCVVVRWEVEGQVNRVRIQVNNQTVWDYAPVRGSWDHCPGSAGVYIYGLITDGNGGTARAAETRVVQGQAPSATLTPAPSQQEPIVYGFSVQPAQIRAGACVTIAWSAGGGAQYIRLLRNSVVILDSGPVTGNIQDCIGEAGAVNYRLEARNNAGRVATGQSAVNVLSQ